MIDPARSNSVPSPGRTPGRPRSAGTGLLALRASSVSSHAWALNAFVLRPGHVHRLPHRHDLGPVIDPRHRVGRWYSWVVELGGAGAGVGDPRPGPGPSRSPRCPRRGRRRSRLPARCGWPPSAPITVHFCGGTCGPRGTGTVVVTGCALHLPVGGPCSRGGRAPARTGGRGRSTGHGRGDLVLALLGLVEVLVPGDGLLALFTVTLALWPRTLWGADRSDGDLVRHRCGAGSRRWRRRRPRAGARRQPWWRATSTEPCSSCSFCGDATLAASPRSEGRGGSPFPPPHRLG